MRSYVVEFIGTLFLVLAIGLSGDPLMIGMMLMAMIYIGGHISGAHYNPAISLAFWMRDKLAAKHIAGYISAQVCGAFVAAFLCYILKDQYIISPGIGIGVGKAILIELLFTFVLALVILNIAIAKKLKGNYIYGLAIGLTVTTLAFTGGEISGGAFNPAVALGPMLFDLIIGGYSIQHLFIYLVGPLGGGILAAVVFKYLNP